MNAELLREFKHAVPFESFVIRMNDGRSFTITDPEDLVIRRGWDVRAIVLTGHDTFAFVYLKNVTSVESRGAIPKLKGRRGRGSGGEND